MSSDSPPVRRDARVPFKARVKVRCDTWERMVALYTQNVSRGGMFLRTENPPELGSDIVVQLALPDGGTVELIAAVVHLVSPERARAERRVPGMGIVFRPLEAAQREQIEQVIELAKAARAVVDSGPNASSAPVPRSAAAGGGGGAAAAAAVAAVPEPPPDEPEPPREAVAFLDPESAKLLLALETELGRLRELRPWEVLGVAPDASQEEIARAYRRLCKRYHPDAFAEWNVGPLRAAASDCFIVVKKAHDRLRAAAGRAPTQAVARAPAAPARPTPDAPPETGTRTRPQGGDEARPPDRRTASTGAAHPAVQPAAAAAPRPILQAEPRPVSRTTPEGGGDPASSARRGGGIHPPFGSTVPAPTAEIPAAAIPPGHRAPSARPREPAREQPIVTQPPAQPMRQPARSFAVPRELAPKTSVPPTRPAGSTAAPPARVVIPERSPTVPPVEDEFAPTPSTLSAAELFGDLSMGVPDRQVKESLSTAVPRNPRRPAADEGLELYREQRYSEARNKLAEALRRDPRDRLLRVTYHLCVGLDLKAQGRDDEARKQFESVLVLDPQNAEAIAALRTPSAEKREEKRSFLKKILDRE